MHSFREKGSQLRVSPALSTRARDSTFSRLREELRMNRLRSRPARALATPRTTCMIRHTETDKITIIDSV